MIPSDIVAVGIQDQILASIARWQEKNGPKGKEAVLEGPESDSEVGSKLGLPNTCIYIYRDMSLEGPRSDLRVPLRPFSPKW